MTATTPRVVPAQLRSTREYRAFLGLAMASAAISIDLLLPAFGEMRRHFGLADSSPATAGLITTFLVGMGLGPLPFGVFSDRFGRRSTLRYACALFVVSAVACAFAPSLMLMKVARFSWGFGAAGLRVASTAMIRDRHSGASMAREVAFAMTVFMLVPIFAPVFGAGLIEILPWRSVFVTCALFGVVLAAWSTRIGETLPHDHRQPFDLRQIPRAASAIVGSRPALAYTLAMIPLFGVFSSYLASSERVVGDVFDRPGWFPYVFGVSAVLMGAASLASGHNVQRIGLQRLILGASICYAVASAAVLALSRATDGRPGFWIYFALFGVVLVCHNVMIPNMNAAAMMPVGHVAGTAAAIMAMLATAGGAVIGSRIDAGFDGTVGPVSAAFLISALVVLALAWWAHPTAGGRRPAAATPGGDHRRPDAR